MGRSCTCCKKVPCNNTINFVIYVHDGYNIPLSCPSINPDTQYNDPGYCCFLKYSQDQSSVGAGNTQRIPSLPFVELTDGGCGKLSTLTTDQKNNLFYDYSNCNYLTPIIRNLELYINDELNISDDFFYIYKNTKKFTSYKNKKCSNTYDYTRGNILASYGTSIINPKTGNTFLTSSDFLSMSKHYYKLGTIASIYLGDTGVKIRCKLKFNNDDGKTIVGMYGQTGDLVTVDSFGNCIKKETKCYAYQNPQFAGYEAEYIFDIPEGFDADIQKLYDLYTSSSQSPGGFAFIYPIFINLDSKKYTYDGSIGGQSTLSITTKNISQRGAGCQLMSSCTANQVAEKIRNLYNLGSYSASYNFQGNFANEAFHCNGAKNELKVVEIKEQVITLPAPNVLPGFAFKWAVYPKSPYYIGGCSPFVSRYISIPYIGASCNYRLNNCNYGSIGTVVQADTYINGGSKKLFSTINTDICKGVLSQSDDNNVSFTSICNTTKDFFGHDILTLINPSHSIIDRSEPAPSQPVPSYLPISYLSNSVPANTIGVVYGVTQTATPIYCNSGATPGIGSISYFFNCPDESCLPLSKHLIGTIDLTTYVGVSIIPNVQLQYDPETECIVPYGLYYNNIPFRTAFPDLLPVLAGSREDPPFVDSIVESFQVLLDAQTS